eukprot:Sdes_comp8778_c0_seq1m148
MASSRKTSIDRKEFLTACSRGDIESVKLTLPRTSMVRRRSSISMLFGGKSDYQSKDAEGNIGLHLAALYNHVNVMQHLCESGFASLINAKNQHTGATPMMLASKHGHIEAVRYCVQMGADIDTTDISGRTALHHAAKSSRYQVVDFLLKSGANPCIQNTVGHTADYQCDHYQTRNLIQAAQKEWQARQLKIEEENQSTASRKSSSLSLANSLFLRLRPKSQKASTEDVSTQPSATDASFLPKKPLQTSPLITITASSDFAASEPSPILQSAPTL